MLEVMGYLFPTFVGLFFLNKRYKLSILDFIQLYFIINIFVNFMTCLTIYIFDGYLAYVFVPSFFIKYTFISSAYSVLFFLLYILLKNNIKISILFKNNEKK